MDTSLYNYDKPNNDYFRWHGLNVNRDVIISDMLLHTHNYYEASIVVGGSAKHVIGNYSYTISRGDVYVIKKGVAHGFYEVDDLDLIDLMYSHDLFLFVDRQLLGLMLSLFIIEPDERMSNYYPYLLKLSDKDLDYVEATADFILQESRKITNYNALVVRQFIISLFVYLSTKYSSDQSVSQVLLNAVQFMQANMATQINIPDVASSVFVSTRHLNRLFRKYLHCTPGDYLLGIRLKHASLLLSKRQLKVGEVSALCGFTDSSYFSRMFKKVYGVTPHKAISQFNHDKT